LKVDGFIVMARGSAEEAERAKALLAEANPSRLEIHPTVKPDFVAPLAVHEAA
jgi:hypothetical protein